MNVPNFLYNMLKNMVAQVQKGNIQSVSHNCLIQLLTKQTLVETNPGMQWLDFLSITRAWALRQVPSIREVAGASSSKVTKIPSEYSSSEDKIFA